MARYKKSGDFCKCGNPSLINRNICQDCKTEKDKKYYKPKPKPQQFQAMPTDKLMEKMKKIYGTTKGGFISGVLATYWGKN